MPPQQRSRRDDQPDAIHPNVGKEPGQQDQPCPVGPGEFPGQARISALSEARVGAAESGSRRSSLSNPGRTGSATRRSESPAGRSTVTPRSDIIPARRVFRQSHLRYVISASYPQGCESDRHRGWSRPRRPSRVARRSRTTCIAPVNGPPAGPSDSACSTPEPRSPAVTCSFRL